MQVGDTIIQQIHFPPLQQLSQKMIVGVRIKSITYNSNSISFSYETLTGHIEKGISKFEIEGIGNRVKFTIHTLSCPNNYFLKLLAPVFSSPYQNFCTNLAINNMKKLFQLENKINSV